METRPLGQECGRGLSDEQLEQPAPVGPNLTLRHIMESAVYAHPNHHLSEMRDFLQRHSQTPSAD